MSHSIFLDLNFGSSYFSGFEFRIILFFWVVKTYDRTSIPANEMLVCPALGLVGCLNSFSFIKQQLHFIRFAGYFAKFSGAVISKQPHENICGGIY